MNDAIVEPAKENIKPLNAIDIPPLTNAQAKDKEAQVRGKLEELISQLSNNSNTSPDSKEPIEGDEKDLYAKDFKIIKPLFDGIKGLPIANFKEKSIIELPSNIGNSAPSMDNSTDRKSINRDEFSNKSATELMLIEAISQYKDGTISREEFIFRLTALGAGKKEFNPSI